MNDSEHMYNAFIKGLWPEALLEKYHPHKKAFGYKGSFFEQDAHLKFLLLSLGSPKLLVSTVGYPHFYHSLEMWTHALSLVDFNEQTLGLSDHLALTADLFQELNALQNMYLTRKKTLTQFKRPVTYSKKDKSVYGDTNAYPCLRAGIIATTVKTCTKYLDLKDHQLRSLQNAAYTISMLYVMAGHNTIENTLNTLEDLGFWGLKV